MNQALAIPQDAHDRFEGRGGLNIAYRSWRPAGKPRAIVAIVPGFNSHSGHYHWVAEQLVQAGMAVFAIDLRGRGNSDGERFYVDKFADYLDDVNRFVSIARLREPGLPVFMLGHSAGGVISSVYTLEHQAEIAGLICESFAYQVPGPEFALAVIKGISHIAPHARVLKLQNKGFSRDPKVVEALENDPLIADEVQPTNTVAEMVRADERLKREFHLFTLPVLIMHGTADSVTVPSGSQYFHDHASSKDKTLKLYEGHFHDLLNDVDKEVVINDIRNWLDAHLPAR